MPGLVMNLFNEKGFLRDIQKIFGLEPEKNLEHKKCIEEVRNSLKKHRRY